MLKIWGLWVKGLQNYWPSNFENDLIPVQLESGPSDSSGAGADYRYQLSCIERSNPFSKIQQDSKGWQHFLVGFAHIYIGVI